MELLRSGEVRPEVGERMFRHGRLGPLCLLAALLAPYVLLGLAHAQLLEIAAALPWFAWFLLAPVVLVGKLLYALVLLSAAQVVRRSFLPTNWLLRVSPAGLVLHLRSFQNTHFPEDGPTVARFAWSEVARVREARDVTRYQKQDGVPPPTRWLQIELAGVDTGRLEGLVRAERERRGPETKHFGITSRGRFGHVPVFVASPGVLRIDWLGAGPLRAFAPHAAVEERLEFDLEHVPDLDARLADLVRRGARLEAVQLARRQLGVSLIEARDLLDTLARKSA
jgi:hypothetical protein